MGRRAVVVVCSVLLAGGWLAVWLAGSRRATEAPPEPSQPAAEPTERPRVPAPRPAPPAAPTPVATETEEAAASASLEVRVVAAAGGEALAGAIVLLDPGGRTPLGRNTDASGVAVFDGLEPGDASVRVRASGYVRGGADASLVRDETTTVEVRMVRGVAVEGTVREERTERVIAGAAVIVSPGGSVGGSIMIRAEPAFGEAETDDRGRYRVDGIEPGAIVTVRALAAGHSPALKSVILEPAGTEPRQVDLHLAPAGAIHGIVRFQDGEPAAGAAVFVIAGDAPEMLRANPTATSMSDGKIHRALRGEAGDDGAYAVGGLDLDAAYDVLAVAGDRGRSEVVEGVIATALEPEVTVDLVVVPPPSLLVRVVDPDGRPQVEGTLFLIGEGFPVQLAAGEPGEFTAAVPAAGHYTLSVTCPGALIEQLPLDIAAGEQREIDVQLDRGLSVSGVLVDDLGTPIPGQKLVINRHWTDAGKLPPSEARATTDDEGRFEAAGLRSGPHAVIAVLGFSPPDDFRIEMPADDVRIVVQRNVTLRARLRLPAGSAVPDGVGVRVGYMANGGFAASGHTCSWNDGEMVLDGVRTTTTRVVIRVPGHLEIVRDVQPVPGTTLDLGEIAVEPGFDFAGRVLDRAGGPVVGAQVSTGMIFTSAHQVVTTDRDGRFTVRGIGERNATIEIEADGFLPRSASVALPWSGNEWQVTLDMGCLLTVHVTDAAKKPAAGGRLRLTPVSEDGVAAEDDSYDVFDIDHRGLVEARQPGGRWRIEALDDEWEPLVTQDVDLVEGGTEEVWLTLPR